MSLLVCPPVAPSCKLLPEQVRVHDRSQRGLPVQACDLVPIVEPEILIDGDYDIHRSSSVSQEVFQVGCRSWLDDALTRLSSAQQI